PRLPERLANVPGVLLPIIGRNFAAQPEAALEPHHLNGNGLRLIEAPELSQAGRIAGQLRMLVLGAEAFLSELMVLKGRSVDALAMIEKAFRLNRYPAGTYYWLLGQAQFLDGQCERAIMTLRHETTYRTESRRMPPHPRCQLGSGREAAGPATAGPALELN